MIALYGYPVDPRRDRRRRMVIESDSSRTGRLAGLRAIVTGAGQGVGRGIALALAKNGAAVVACGRTLEKVERTAAEIRMAGGDAVAIRCDVGSATDIDDLFAETVSRLGGL